MEKEPQKRNKPFRKLLKRKFLLPAVIAVAVVAVVLFFAIRGNKAPVASGAEDKTVIHLSAGGDLNITDDVVAAVGSDGSYRQAMRDVLHLLSAADLSVLNFEGNFCGAP